MESLVDSVQACFGDSLRSLNAQNVARFYNRNGFPFPLSKIDSSDLLKPPLVADCEMSVYGKANIVLFSTTGSLTSEKFELQVTDRDFQSTEAGG